PKTANASQVQPGVSAEGIQSGPRSPYGTTKLAAELLVEEYRAMYGLRTVINRCGVVSGPRQMCKIVRALSCCGCRAICSADFCLIRASAGMDFRCAMRCTSTTSMI